MKLVPPNQKSSLHSPRAAESLHYDDMREHAEHDILRDFRTNCIPSQTSYISFRDRRALDESHPDFETLKDNMSDFVVWTVPGKEDEVQLLPVYSQGNHIKTKMKYYNQTGEENEDYESNNNEDKEFSTGDVDETASGNLKSHVVYNDNRNEEKSQDLDGSEHQEEDKFEKEPITDRQ